MPRVLWWSRLREKFLMREVPLYGEKGAFISDRSQHGHHVSPAVQAVQYQDRQFMQHDSGKAPWKTSELLAVQHSGASG